MTNGGLEVNFKLTLVQSKVYENTEDSRESHIPAVILPIFKDILSILAIYQKKENYRISWRQQFCRTYWTSFVECFVENNQHKLSM